jgi:hypothetical protein
MGSGPASRLTLWVDVRMLFCAQEAGQRCTSARCTGTPTWRSYCCAAGRAPTRAPSVRVAAGPPACRPAPPAEACLVLSRQRGAGVGVRAGDIPGGATPLHWAAQGSHQVRHVVLPRGHLTLTPCNDVAR